MGFHFKYNLDFSHLFDITRTYDACLAIEVLSETHDFFRLQIQRKVPGVQDVYLGPRVILPVRFSTGYRERRIVTSPKTSSGGLCREATAAIRVGLEVVIDNRKRDPTEYPPVPAGSGSNTRLPTNRDYTERYLAKCRRASCGLLQGTTGCFATSASWAGRSSQKARRTAQSGDRAFFVRDGILDNHRLNSFG